jgi:hypothetical protein
MTGTLVRLRSIDDPQSQPSVMHIELATASYRVIGLIWPFDQLRAADHVM